MKRYKIYFKTFSIRKWYFEERDWIVFDEVKDDTEEMTKEELVAEEEVRMRKRLLLLVLQQFCIFQMEIPTVAVESDKKENTVCRQEFDTFKQVNILIKCQLLLNLYHLSG